MWPGDKKSDSISTKGLTKGTPSENETTFQTQPPLVTPSSPRAENDFACQIMWHEKYPKKQLHIFIHISRQRPVNRWGRGEAEDGFLSVAHTDNVRRGSARAGGRR